jgi:farnesyl-diphosphate farnesyltransferase
MGPRAPDAGAWLLDYSAMSRPESTSRVALIEDLLVKTSRTFALSIPRLPEPLRGEVTVAYLLFRIADTLEDATNWTTERQIEELERLARLLRRPSEPDACRLAAAWTADPPLDHEGCRELLAETPAVVEALLELGAEAGEQVREHTLRTIECMASYVRRSDKKKLLQLQTLKELQAYCYAVAGIVGEMLTELFLLECRELDGAAGFLRERAVRFGEALQLVNILKDSASDATEGRRYLPQGVALNKVFALARRDLEGARAYVESLQQAEAPRGLIEFTALPVLLARATLDRVERDGAGAKLTREEVRQISGALALALDGGQAAIPPVG